MHRLTKPLSAVWIAHWGDHGHDQIPRDQLTRPAALNQFVVFHGGIAWICTAGLHQAQLSAHDNRCLSSRPLTLRNFFTRQLLETKVMSFFSLSLPLSHEQIHTRYSISKKKNLIKCFYDSLRLDTLSLCIAVVGQMKMILSTAIGAAMFGTALNPKQAVGLGLNTLGGCMFAWAKYREASRNDKREDGQTWDKKDS